MGFYQFATVAVLMMFATAYAVNYGNPPAPGHVYSGPKSSFILLDYTLSAGFVQSFTVFTVGPNLPMRLQVWRPMGGNRYKLVGEIDYKTEKPGVHKVDTLGHGGHIVTRAGDFIGFTITTMTGPLGYDTKKVRGARVACHEYRTKVLSEVGKDYVFEKTYDNKLFSISATIVNIVPTRPPTTTPKAPKIPTARLFPTFPRVKPTHRPFPTFPRFHSTRRPYPTFPRFRPTYPRIPPTFAPRRTTRREQRLTTRRPINPHVNWPTWKPPTVVSHPTAEKVVGQNDGVVNGGVIILLLVWLALATVAIVGAYVLLYIFRRQGQWPVLDKMRLSDCYIQSNA